MTFLTQAFRNAEASPERTFLLDRLGPLDYGETCLRIRQLTGLVGSWGLEPGRRVLLAAREDRTTAVAFLALLACGHPVVLLDPATGPERARALLALSDPGAWLVDADLIESWGLAGAARVLALLPETSAGHLQTAAPLQADRESYPACLRHLRPAEWPPAADPGRDAYILFTSGTTDEPKGVCITRAALAAHLASLGRAFGYDSGCVVFNSLPLSHGDGLVQGPALAFVQGATLLRPFPFQIQTLDLLLDALGRHRATHLVATPTMLALLVRYGSARAEAFRSGPLRFVISCAAALEADLQLRFERTFGVPVANHYGLTETVSGGLLAGPGVATRRPGMVGWPLDCEARIVAGDGSLCADSVPGELQLRGPMVMRGYLEAPAATAQVLDAEGWLRTGDLALREVDGCYRILGRLKALIIRGGDKIQPEEVTEALHAHPGVLAAVTFGLPDPIWGEQVYSAVVAAPGSALTEAGLTAHCRARLEGPKVPSRILFLDELPRSRSGKVRLERVRELALAARAGTGSEAGGGALLGGVLAEAAACFRLPLAMLDPGTCSESCPGWDSLAHLGFVAGLETRFGIRLEPEDIVAISTLGDAVRVVAAHLAAV
jgi:long-chain acyl-CoA synthetase